MISWHHFFSGLLLVSISIYNAPLSLALTVSNLEDGDFLKIVSVSSGKVLTASGPDATDGKPIEISPWNRQPNQKWMAVEALVAGNSFVMMPQRQTYPWARFIRNGGTDPYKNRYNDLPDGTVVIEANTHSGQVTQDARDGKLNQQWRAEKVESPSGGKKFLIKNRQNNQCLQVPASLSSSTSTTTPATTTTKKHSFLHKLWSDVKSDFEGSSNSSSSTASPSEVTGNVILAPCDSTDVRQYWEFEMLALE